MIDSVVSVSEQAFFSIVTSALEAYKLEHVLTNGDSAAGVETFGHLWGYCQQTIGTNMMYRVVWADTSTAVERDQGSVAYTDEAQELKQGFIDTFSRRSATWATITATPTATETTRSKPNSNLNGVTTTDSPTRISGQLKSCRMKMLWTTVSAWLPRCSNVTGR